MTRNKLRKYFETQVRIMTKLYPDEDPEKIKEIVKDIIVERDMQKEKTEITIEFPDPEKPIVKNVPLKNLEKKLEKEQPIITKYGTVFYRQDEKESILSQMMAFLANERKRNKKKMLDHLNDEDDTMYRMYDMIQQTIKILMNSFYGVLTAKGSIFRSLDCGESVTSCGELIIMTAISIFERFLTNNIRFYNETDMILYCHRIINEEYKCLEDYDIFFNQDITIEELMNYFYKHLVDENVNPINIKWDKNSTLYKYLNTLSNDELNKIYYKNNLMKFFNNANIGNDDEIMRFIDGFEDIFKGIFLDPNEPNEEQEEILNCLWSILNDFVFYDYQNYHKFIECHKGKRRTVLTVKLYLPL